MTKKDLNKTVLALRKKDLLPEEIAKSLGVKRYEVNKILRSRGKGFTTTDRARIMAGRAVKAHKDGYTKQEIAKSMRISVVTVERYFARSGYKPVSEEPKRTGMKPLTLNHLRHLIPSPILRRDILDLHARGWPVVEIAANVGLEPDIVERFLVVEGLIESNRRKGSGDIEHKRPVRIDKNTTIFIRPGKDPEQAVKEFLEKRNRKHI